MRTAAPVAFCLIVAARASKQRNLLTPRDGPSRLTRPSSALEASASSPGAPIPGTDIAEPNMDTPEMKRLEKIFDEVNGQDLTPNIQRMNAGVTTSKQHTASSFS